MGRTPRKFSPEFKAKVVLDILISGKSMSQASREYGIKDTVLTRWKQAFIERSPRLFEQDQGNDESDQTIAELERLVGRLTLELDAVKKVSSYLNIRSNSDGR